MQYWNFVERLQGLPTRYKYVDINTKCCEIHRAVPCGYVGALGCAGLPYGTHRSIRAVYEGAALVCHAEVGARVIDRRVFFAVVSGHESFFGGAFRRSMSFRRKFMAGAAIGWQSYGAGYCHLIPVEDCARSRVARCLGPNPLVTDSARFLLAFGAYDTTGYSLTCVAPGVYHVTKGGGLSFETLLGNLVGIAEDFPDSVLGCDNPDIVGRGRVGYRLDSFLSCVPRPVIELDTSSDLYGQYIGDRSLRLVSWLSSHGIQIADVDLDQLLYVTCAASAVSGGGSEVMRSHLRSMALVGDAVLKVFHSAYVASVFGKPHEYTTISQMASNPNLTLVFCESGLRACSNVKGLAADSKANATLMEAFIGVLAGCIPGSDLLIFLRSIGLAPAESFSYLMPVIYGKGVSAGLSSDQYSRALELVRSGVL